MNRERAKELLPIIQAYADGKDIEFICKYGAIKEWQVIDDPGFYNESTYRIKPEVPYTVPRHIEGFRALRDGEEWFLGKHTWGKDDLPEGFRPLLQSEIDNYNYDDIEYFDGRKWMSPNLRCADGDSETYRTTRHLPTVKIKKKVPLEARDILPGSVIKLSGWHPARFDSITRVNMSRVTTETGDISYERLKEDYNIHHPSYGYKNSLPVWKPCYKEIEVEES